MRRTTLFFPIFLLASVGCKEAERASKDLEGATTDLFTLFESEDTVELGLTILDLEAAIADIKDEPDLAARSFQFEPLSGDALGGAPTVPDTDPANQTPGVVVGMSRHDYAANLGLAFELNQVCIESNTTVWYGRTLIEGGDCFESGGCEFLRTTNEVLKKNLLATAWYDLFKDYRTVALDDGREALIARSWTEEIFYAEGGGGNNFAQNYSVELWLEDPADAGTTQRVYALWAEINIGLGPEFMRNQIIDGLDEGMINADGFLSDDLSNCTADRDRAYDRPQE